MHTLNPKNDLRLWLGLFERELQPHYWRLVKRGSHCFDVGGTEGYYALMLAKLSGEAVTVFEPGDGWPEHRPIAHNRWLVCEGRS